jgi:L-lactate dehydrogenase complex protein LldG
VANDSRAAILGRLRAADAVDTTPVPGEDFATVSARGWSAEEKLARLRRNMEAVHAEFLEARGGDWVRPVHAWMVEQGLPTLAYAPNTAQGRRLKEAWPDSGPPLVPYDRPLADWKAELFAGDGAGITETLGGIAATGTLILWTDADRPRTLSLVPPVHIAVLDVNQLYDTMREAMLAQKWANAMPTNLVFVSGPSKTADIEQTLAYGVHGPKRLLVVLTDG